MSQLTMSVSQPVAGDVEARLVTTDQILSALREEILSLGGLTRDLRARLDSHLLPEPPSAADASPKLNEPLRSVHAGHLYDLLVTVGNIREYLGETVRRLDVHAPAPVPEKSMS